MSKVYQKEVLKQSEEFIESLIESEFFKEYEINNLTFAKEYVLEKINDKYISQIVQGEDNILFTEQEFTEILQNIVAGSLLYELKEKGFINSYEDENTDETFFLTEKGKTYLKNEKDINLD
jgi:hypothetical protein